MATETKDQRVAEAKAIKAERDRKALPLRERLEAEDAEMARVRAEKIAAGLLGVCPKCKRMVDTAEGIVLNHPDTRWPPHAEIEPCNGTGEAMLPVDAAEQPSGSV